MKNPFKPSGHNKPSINPERSLGFYDRKNELPGISTLLMGKASRAETRAWEGLSPIQKFLTINRHLEGPLNQRSMPNTQKLWQAIAVDHHPAFASVRLRHLTTAEYAVELNLGDAAFWLTLLAAEEAFGYPIDDDAYSEENMTKPFRFAELKTQILDSGFDDETKLGKIQIAAFDTLTDLMDSLRPSPNAEVDLSPSGPMSFGCEAARALYADAHPDLNIPQSLRERLRLNGRRIMFYIPGIRQRNT